MLVSFQLPLFADLIYICHTSKFEYSVIVSFLNVKMWTDTNKQRDISRFEYLNSTLQFDTIDILPHHDVDLYSDFEFVIEFNYTDQK